MKIHFTDNTSSEIKKIFCLGLNYTEHINEMSHRKTENPVVFLKPQTAICYDNDTVEIPALSQRMDYELEMLIYLKSGGKFLDDTQAKNCIGAYGVGIDLTLRDLQKQAKESGLPWTVAKGFDKSAPISVFQKIKNPDCLNNLEMILYVNKETKQKVNTSEMLFKPVEIIKYLSQFFTLQQGDIIFTGTPSGIGKLNSGDIVEASINKQLSLKIYIK